MFTSTARFALVVALTGIQNADAYGELDKFLIVSSSSTHQIAYAPIPKGGLTGDIKLRTLISEGLTFPQGLAVDPWRKYLYVADPTLNQLVYYKLDPRSDDQLYVGEQFVAAKGVEVRWVACDSLGNVYFTVESTQRVMRITADNLDKGFTNPELVFEGSQNGMVSAPGGIAVDNYFAYWSNKLDPEKSGAIIQSMHAPNSKSKPLLKINAKTYGVCTAVNNVFFTDETKNLYGIPRLGGLDAPVKVSTAFAEARGCAWDGQNTVYVADKKNNAIYKFPAAMPTLREEIPIQLVANMEGAYGVAVYSVTQSAGALGLSPSLLVSALLALFAVFAAL